MMGWLIQLKPVFTEAVALFCDSSISSNNNLLNSFVIHELAEDHDYDNLYSEELAKLLLHLLKNTTNLGYFGIEMIEIEKVFRRLVSGAASRQVLKDICNELSKLGFHKALELDKLLDD